MSAGDGSRAVCAVADRVTCDAYLAWDTAHGWHALWGWGPWPLGNFPPIRGFRSWPSNLRKSLGSPAAVDACFAEVAESLARQSTTSGPSRTAASRRSRTRSSPPFRSRAWRSRPQATASVSPESGPISGQRGQRRASVDIVLARRAGREQHAVAATDVGSPQTFDHVVVHFLQHPSMHGRTIHLQRETAAGTWEDLATTVIPSRCRRSPRRGDVSATVPRDA